MSKHVILPRIAKPPLKKIVKTVVKKTIIAPPRSRPAIQEAIKPYRAASIQPKSPQRLRQVPKNKEPLIRYAAPEPHPETISRINRLRNIGLGRRLVIMGNGPSLGEVDVAQLKDMPKLDTLMVNRPDQRVWPTTYWSFFDQSQLRRHKAFIDTYPGMMFNSPTIKLNNARSIQFKSRNRKRFSLDLTEGIHIGRSSVYASMQIALWMGYDRIYILGVDMHPDGVNGNLHYYGTNPDVDPKVRKMSFTQEADNYLKAVESLGENAKRFVFASSYNPWEFVNSYIKADHRQIIQTITEESANYG